MFGQENFNSLRPAAADRFCLRESASPSAVSTAFAPPAAAGSCTTGCVAGKTGEPVPDPVCAVAGITPNAIATSILQKIDFFILSKYLIHIKQKQCTRNRT
ncbi:MAG: hypothetical protein ACLR8Y_08740 [Alistipes indistinctus]